MSIRIETNAASLLDVNADTLIVNKFEDASELGGATGAVDEAIGGHLSQLIGNGQIKGRLGEAVVVHTLGLLPADRIVVAGLGKRADFGPEQARRAAAAAVQAARKAGAKVIATVVHGAGTGGLDPAAAARACTEGMLLGLYRFDEFKSKSSDERVERIVMCETDETKLAAVEAGAALGETMAAAANFARDLANRPPNVLNPVALAAAAEQMCNETGLQFETLGPEEMERLGMGALLGVARGSAQPPRLIVMRHRGSSEERPLALVGKGVTFDTGGISLKPAQDMEYMKFDMSGAAAVIGAMQAIGRLKPARSVIGIVGAVENMPDGQAQRPGDIVRAMNGKTIEIINTDAEGRLVLADAVAYAAQQGAAEIVDVATLTGACVIALGKHTTGLIANDDGLAEAVKAAAAAAGERVWQLPAFPEYRKQLESNFADLKNTGGRPAGTITGGLFIGEFVGDVPWVHLDIAGTADSVPDIDYWQKTSGATGIMVRTLAQLALDHA